MRYLLRFILLMIGFALVTAGLIAWQAIDFSFNGILFFDNDYHVHPVHLLVLGLAMIPPTLWEIFALEQQLGRPYDRSHISSQNPSHNSSRKPPQDQDDN